MKILPTLLKLERLGAFWLKKHFYYSEYNNFRSKATNNFADILITIPCKKTNEYQLNFRYVENVEIKRWDLVLIFGNLYHKKSQMQVYYSHITLCNKTKKIIKYRDNNTYYENICIDILIQSKIP